MPLITKRNGRFTGKWTYAIPREQRKAPTPSKEIRLARVEAQDRAGAGEAVSVANDRWAA